MSVNESRAVQRVLNELADEGCVVERDVVENSVAKALDTDVKVFSEDELVEYVVSALSDAVENGLLGEELPEGEHGGIVISEGVEFEFESEE